MSGSYSSVTWIRGTPLPKCVGFHTPPLTDSRSVSRSPAVVPRNFFTRTYGVVVV